MPFRSKLELCEPAVAGGDAASVDDADPVVVAVDDDAAVGVLAAAVAVVADAAAAAVGGGGVAGYVDAVADVVAEGKLFVHGSDDIVVHRIGAYGD